MLGAVITVLSLLIALGTILTTNALWFPTALVCGVVALGGGTFVHWLVRLGLQIAVYLIAIWVVWTWTGALLLFALGVVSIVRYD